MSNSYAQVKKAKEKRKLQIVQVMGNSCAICGYNKSIHALELHHINPKDKEFSFSKLGSFPNWEKLKKELSKCILLCANCHREVHDISIETPELISSYNNSIAEQFQNDVQIKKYYCSNCGKQTWGKTRTGLCSDCLQLEKRIVERPSREELKNLIKNTPFTKIGLMYGVSDNTIRKWCKSVNLPSKVSDIKDYSEEEWSEI